MNMTVRWQQLYLSALGLCVMAAFGLAQAADPQPAPAATPTSRPKISTADEFKTEFEQVPCKNDARLTAVKALFERLGAAPEAISVAKFKNVENLVITKPGNSPEKIVIGAHYDKVSEGCGALDNWTGIVAIAHLYRTLKDLPSEKTLVFVAFGKEEEGLVGSAAMTNEIPKEQLPGYCAMVNVDSLGIGIPQVMRNTSNPVLEKLAEEVAQTMQMPFGKAAIEGADADSSSFLRKKIPAVTLHALNNEWPKLLHSGNDQPAKVNVQSVYLGYRLALAMLVKIDEADCQAFREVKKK
jgi:Iap family predicted aminopeptidase